MQTHRQMGREWIEIAEGIFHDLPVKILLGASCPPSASRSFRFPPNRRISRDSGGLWNFIYLDRSRSSKALIE